MWDALTRVELVKSGLNFGEKQQSFDRIVDRCVRRHFTQRFDNPISGEWFHDS